MEQDFDAIVVGAGFGGIYQLYKLVAQGLSVKVIDQAGDVGGTWYWNRYPGAMSDTESYIYRFSWDHEDLLQYHWKDHYVKQPEVLAYLNHVVDRHNLRKHMQFNTQLASAQYDERFGIWRIHTATDETFTARYLITSLGLLSKQNYPNIPGLNDFKGELYHTGQWPRQHDFKNKRVGVIGNGSTGVQVITAIAHEVKTLISFQRHPQYSVPSGDRPVSQSYRDQINAQYTRIWEQVRNSDVGFGFRESRTAAMSVSAGERDRIFEEAWSLGNGFRFMFWTFSDITTDPAANEEACKFIRRKIGEKVTDPEKARKLKPMDYYARRPLCDSGYYEQFNRENVDVVLLTETPITRVMDSGIEIADGSWFELDAIVLATGFDAVDGNYTRVAIQGRNGETLKDHWDVRGPSSYLGMAVPGFPNLFMISGPNGPFSNVPPNLEVQVEFISDIILKAEHSLDWSSKKERGRSGSIGGRPVVEARQEAEDEWTRICDEASKDSLFRKTPSWIFGANVEGKKRQTMFYFSGLKAYCEQLDRVVKGGYVGFQSF